ncbi:MAG: BLUF domain-containing protein [Pseudomonadota bacterium]
MVKQIVYRSKATIEITPEVVGDILTVAQENNTRFAVTGLLLYGDGIFMQVLEGSPDSTDEIYSRIRQDPRHCDVRDLYTGYADLRAYPDWQMACRPLIASKRPGEDVFQRATDILDQYGGGTPVDIGSFMRSFSATVMVPPAPDKSTYN